ncbi:thioether cross-link-forming SCIFF peptide maturase [Candidatus Contubernalis alkalaceticus]|nr:thioether cross-link-forming SCIFF peptide maturase [Candidatus Contubernalis alkalaceticus]
MIHKYCYDDLKIVLDVNSGAVHLVDPSGWEIISLLEQGFDLDQIAAQLEGKYHHQVIAETLEEIGKLIENGLLFSPDFLEGYKRPSEYIIKAMCFHMAHDCNMECSYCFAGKGSFGGKKSLMSREVAFRGVDFIIKNSGSRKNCEVDFFGGEPLLNFQVIKDTVDYARKKGRESGKEFKFTLTTNGLLLNQEVQDYVIGQGFSVVLSLDGRKEVNDRVRVLKKNGSSSYDRLVPKYLKFVEERNHQEYYLRGTFTAYNQDFSEDLKHLASLGFKEISLEPVVAPAAAPYALKEEHLPQLYCQYEQISRFYLESHGTESSFSFFHFNLDLSRGPCIKKRLAGCGAGTEYLALSPEGHIYPCHQFVGEKEFLMGDVTRSMEFDRIIYEGFLKVNVNSKEECGSCWAKFYCGGGCHANAHHFNGDVYKPYALGCKLEKKRLECALAVQAEIFLAQNS